MHVWTLEPTATGTLLHNEESIQDWDIDAADQSAVLRAGLDGWNQLLAERVRVLR